MRQPTLHLRANANSLVSSVRTAIACLGLLSSAVMPLSAHAQTGTVTYLYNFTDGADGGEPVGGVVQDAAGTLYGETSIGGVAGCTSQAGQPKGGCGTVYSFNPSTGLKVLASFTGPNGAYGMTTLTLVGTTLYGTTNNGGTSDDGVVFSVQTDGTGFTLLHQFSGVDGKNPTSILRQGAGGVLYGITEYGGTHNDGVLFSLKPNGTYSVLHDFSGGTKDGETPTTLLISSSGTLVGSSEQGGNQSRICDTGGCGTIFEYVPSSKIYSVAYKFVGGNGFGGFIGSIGPGPTVYGNDIEPFALSLATGLVQYASFSGADQGGFASGPLLAPDGSLIGVEGAGSFSGGELYSATKTANTSLANLGDPMAQPLLLPSGNIIGTAVEGPAVGYEGSIWEYVP